MHNFFARIFTFLAPIMRQAVVQAASDSLARVAYPDRPVRRRSTSAYDRYPFSRGPFATAVSAKRSMEDIDRLEAERLARRQAWREAFKPERVPGSEGFHDILMVAFDLRGDSAINTQKWIIDNMPAAEQTYGDKDEIFLDSWWIANDERFDGSSTDSAVFVTKGKQAEARALLRKNGLLA